MKTIILFLLLLSSSISFGQSNIVTNIPSVEIYFSPKGGCADAITNVISKATNFIYVQAYSFTSKTIAESLITARKRGICNIQVILDKGQENDRSVLHLLSDNDIITLIDKKHSISHNKIIIIDNRIVITGSYNFTNNAEKNNAENLLIITDTNLSQIYLDNWIVHQNHSILTK